MPGTTLEEEMSVLLLKTFKQNQDHSAGTFSTGSSVAWE